MSRLAYALLIVIVSVLTGCASAPPDPNKDAIRLVQSKRGAAIAIQDRLLFDVGSAVLRPGSEEVMDKVADILKAKAQSQVMIEGHTDNQGSGEYNMKLSENRALSVRQALVSRGIDAGRMTTKGYGFTEPVDTNDTPEGRQLNRRAEVVFPGTTVEELKKGSEEKFNFGGVVRNALGSIKKLFGEPAQ